MTTPIGSSNPYAAQAIGQPPATTSTSTTSIGPAIGGDAFLKLLVAQLKYQDPSKPVDSAAFMAQTAQMQMVETLHELVDQNSAVIAGQNSLSALALVGQRVTYTVGGTSASGTVDSVKLTATGPKLLVNDTEVPLNTVTEVARGATPPSTTGSTSPTSGTPTAPATAKD